MLGPQRAYLSVTRLEVCPEPLQRAVRGIFLLREVGVLALTSSSTNAQVWAEYEDNSDYDITGDVAKVKLFIVACRFILRRMAEEFTKGGATVKERYEKIQKQLDEALAWWRSNDTSAVSAGTSETVVYSDFRDFRD